MSTLGHLNSSQRLHLLTSCQYADKLLSEIEATLARSQSKSPFPKFQPDMAMAQAKVVEDYIARIRARLVRILESQDIAIPAPLIGSLHSIRVTLGFVNIAFDECRARRMAGYGDLPESAATEIAGFVDEIQGIVSRLDSYLADSRSADLGKRLQRLEEAGGDTALVKALEQAIDRHGLVEFRPALGTIVDRLEMDAFEIAVFGRVSSGKSSLLNHIVERDVLPVGVNPITAVPTQLAYGSAPLGTAWFADRKPEQFGVERLAEFVTEESNPANWRHVTRIVVALPARRLQRGVVYVDTPGLGSLATCGAAETKAYLPRCDLGVVLIDAGSTLTEDDLATVQALYGAGIPASVVLSKADLLAEKDRERALQYVAQHLRSDLGLELPVHAVSTRSGHGGLFERWLASEILPLYDRHAERARQSLNRKIGALRLGVEAALQARLGRPRPVTLDEGSVRDLETALRTASGTIAQARTRCLEIADMVRESADGLIRTAVNDLVEAGRARAGAAPGDLVQASLEQAVAEPAARIASAIQEAARHAGGVLTKAAAALGLDDRPEQDELLDVLKNMPRFELGGLVVNCGSCGAASLPGSPLGGCAAGAAHPFAGWQADCGCPGDSRARASILGAQDLHRIAGTI